MLPDHVGAFLPFYSMHEKINKDAGDASYRNYPKRFVQREAESLTPLWLCFASFCGKDKRIATGPEQGQKGNGLWRLLGSRRSKKASERGWEGGTSETKLAMTDLGAGTEVGDGSGGDSERLLPISGDIPERLRNGNPTVSFDETQVIPSELDWLPLATFVLVIVATVYLVVKPHRWFHFSMPPVLGVILLMLTASMTPADVWKGGVLGDEKLQPITIVTIFFSLAYICVALDLTGILAYIALKVAQKAGSSGLRLFFFIFLLSSCFTILTSNDIVILTLTPIIVYCCQATDIDPQPLLFAVFFPANICSVILIIGNPTNIIVGEANNLTFVSYSRWMILPALAMNVICYIVLLIIFNKQIMDFQPLVLNPISLLNDGYGAVFISVSLFVTLTTIIVAPSLDISIWKICLGGAALVFVRNACFWAWRRSPSNIPTESEFMPISEAGTSCRSTPSHPKTGDDVPLANLYNETEGIVGGSYASSIEPATPPRVFSGQCGQMGALRSSSHDSLRTAQNRYISGLMTVSPSFINHPIVTPTKRYQRQSEHLLERCGTKTDLGDCDYPLLSSASVDSKAWAKRSISAPKAYSGEPDNQMTVPLPTFDTQNDNLDKPKVELSKNPMPTMEDSIRALPWSIVPFVFGMFVLVEALEISGWLDAMAVLLANGMRGRGAVACVFITTVLTIVLSNFINNQPTTILLTRVLLAKEYQSLGHIQQHAGMLGVILGSNVAANFTLLGALAGIMYARILRDKGLNLSFLGFFKIGMLTMIVTTSVGCLILGLDLAYTHPYFSDFHP
eukprot:g48136.t1